MSDPKAPWWYSGDDDAPQPEEPPTPQGEGFGIPGVDWSALASGAQRLVDWATDRVMAPHADHADPREHPQCVVCRTILLLADRPGGPSTAPEEPVEVADEIAWIPIVGDPSDP